MKKFKLTKKGKEFYDKYKDNFKGFFKDYKKYNGELVLSILNKRVDRIPIYYKRFLREIANKEGNKRGKK